MRVGVFLPNWVGDVVMATPALRALREHVGSGELVGIMRPYVAEVLAGAPWFDDAVVYDKHTSRVVRTGCLSDQSESRSNADVNAARVTYHLRSLHLDSIILLTNSLRTAWMAYCSGARERIGTAANLRSPLLTTRVYAPRRRWRQAPLPTVAGYLQVVQAAGAPPVAPLMELSTTPADERFADSVWQRLGWPSHSRVAVLNTGGAFGAAKDWPGENFAVLASRLAEQNWRVLVNCGPKERDAARAIVAAAGDSSVASLADEPELPIGLTKAVIRRARLLVTTDSGPRFFGVAFGVPTVTLFGPTSRQLTPTYSELETSVSLALDCQPCMKRVCPLGHHRCMRDLSVDRVMAAIHPVAGVKRAAA